MKVVVALIVAIIGGIFVSKQTAWITRRESDPAHAASDGQHPAPSSVN